MKPKLSPWHSEDTKPVHIGIYQVMFLGVLDYAYWDSKKWYLSHTKQDMAEAFHINGVESWSQNKQWRGIVK